MQKTIIFPVLMSLILAGCGLLPSKRPPDETAVFEGPSLALPPNYTLRPPKEAAAAAKKDREEQGQKILFGVQTQTEEVAEKAPTENWLVKQAGGETRKENIRQTLEKDYEKEQNNEEKGWLKRQKEAVFGEADEEKAQNK